MRRFRHIVSIAVFSFCTWPVSDALADPCLASLCMYGAVQGGSGGPVCVAGDQAYFQIRIFDELGVFDPVSTAAARDVYLHSCPDFANEPWKEEVTLEFGARFDGP